VTDGAISRDAAPLAARPFGPLEWALTGVIAFIWGGSFLFIRIGLETFGAGLVPALRIAFGVLALGLLPSSRRPIDRADWPRVVLLGVVWMALPFVLFSLAERTVPTAIAGMINGAVPLATAAVAALMHRRAPSLRRGVALLLGLFGVSVIALSVAHDAERGADLAGIFMLLAAVVCYGVSANLALPLQRRYGSIAVLFRVQLVALLASVPFALVASRTASFTWTAMGAMFLLGAFGTGLAYAVLATLVGRTDATRGTIGVFLTPIVATVLGVTVRQEQLPAAALVGAALILAGAILTSRPEPA
jgi:drug/metabolite transporter (DMT)-like permease